VPHGGEREEAAVTIGGSAALIIIGAILRFAVTWTPKNVDLQVVGVILMIGGVAGLCVAIGLMVMKRRQQSSARVIEQRRYIEPPL
jgi:Domain of unknown function (DUF6458)